VTLGREPGFFEVERGIRLFLDPDDYFQCMMFYGRYAPEILELLGHYCGPGDVAVDAGAHIGYLSIHLAHIVTPTGHVYSFEPDPRAYATMVRSAEENRMPQVDPFPVALSARRGNMEFYLSPQLGWSTAAGQSHLSDLRAITVETIPLDDLVESGKVLQPIRLVKLDVEGFEGEVLRGMRRILTRSRPILLVEVNAPMLRAHGDSSTSLLNLVRSFQYDVFAIEKRNKWFWHKGVPVGTRRLREGESLIGGDVVCIPSAHATR
jgi:FkbM family methyltransferase